MHFTVVTCCSTSKRDLRPQYFNMGSDLECPTEAISKQFRSLGAVKHPIPIIFNTIKFIVNVRECIYVHVEKKNSPCLAWTNFSHSFSHSFLVGRKYMACLQRLKKPLFTLRASRLSRLNNKTMLKCMTIYTYKTFLLIVHTSLMHIICKHMFTGTHLVWSSRSR